MNPIDLLKERQKGQWDDTCSHPAFALQGQDAKDVTTSLQRTMDAAVVGRKVENRNGLVGHREPRACRGPWRQQWNMRKAENRNGPVVGGRRVFWGREKTMMHYKSELHMLVCTAR